MRAGSTVIGSARLGCDCPVGASSRRTGSVACEESMRGSISDPEAARKAARAGLSLICSGRAGVLTVGETMKPESGAFALDGRNAWADRVGWPVRASWPVRLCTAPSFVSRLCAVADSKACPVGSSSGTCPVFCAGCVKVSAIVRRAAVSLPGILFACKAGSAGVGGVTGEPARAVGRAAG